MSPEKQSTSSLKKEFTDTAQEFGRYVEEMGKDVSDTVKDRYDETAVIIKDYVKKNPVLAIGVAAAIGAAIALIIRR